MDNNFDASYENQKLNQPSTAPSAGSTASGGDNFESTYSTGGDLGKPDASRNLKDAAARKTANVRQRVSDYTHVVAQKVDASRQPVADSLYSTASIVEERGQRVAGAAHSVAGKIRSGAEYIRSNDLDNMVEDIADSVKRYPTFALGAAAIVGFLIGRLAPRN
jgi:hypothetical protein